MDIISWGIKLGHTTFAKGGGGREKEKPISVAHIFSAVFLSARRRQAFFAVVREASNNIGERGKEKRAETRRKRQTKKGLLSVQQQGPSVPDTILFFPLVAQCKQREISEVAEIRKYRGRKAIQNPLPSQASSCIWRPYSSVSPLVTGPHARAPQAVPSIERARKIRKSSRIRTHTVVQYTALLVSCFHSFFPWELKKARRWLPEGGKGGTETGGKQGSARKYIKMVQGFTKLSH